MCDGERRDGYGWERKGRLEMELVASRQAVIVNKRTLFLTNRSGEAKSRSEKIE